MRDSDSSIDSGMTSLLTGIVTGIGIKVWKTPGILSYLCLLGLELESGIRNFLFRIGIKTFD